MANYLNESLPPLNRDEQRFAIVVSSYNDSVTEPLLTAALETLQHRQVPDDQIDVVRVPGAWELALATRAVLQTGRYDGVVALGAVIRGETTHDLYINRFVSQALGQLSLESGIPVGFGLLTCENYDQAVDRSGGDHGNKGEEATAAMLEMVSLLNCLSN